MPIPSHESETVEFKRSFDREAIETLCAFANAQGGSVYIGIDDAGRVIGTTDGKETASQWINQVKLSTAPSLFPVIEQITIGADTVVRITVQEYPLKPVSFKGR